MNAHDHRTYVDGCFRCDLSREEASTPRMHIHDALTTDDALRDEQLEPLGDAQADYITSVILDALDAAGYQVVTVEDGMADDLLRRTNKMLSLLDPSSAEYDLIADLMGEVVHLRRDIADMESR